MSGARDFPTIADRFFRDWKQERLLLLLALALHRLAVAHGDDGGLAGDGGRIRLTLLARLSFAGRVSSWAAFPSRWRPFFAVTMADVRGPSSLAGCGDTAGPPRAR
jgi:hypothetical protein